LIACACSSGVQADSGVDAAIQVAGAQFVRGPMPEGGRGGPSVIQVSLVNNNLWPGLTNDPITGALGPTATAVALGLMGDAGYWVLVAGTPDVATPGDPSFAGSLAFSPAIQLGTYTLVVRAVDGSGQFGPASEETLVAEASPTDPPAAGALVVTLTWDTESNLNLHVVDPDGVDLYWDNPSTQLPPSTSASDGGSYGYIDYDSNANCVIDGLRREDAIWPTAPPRGPYTARVDAASLCGQPMANWEVRVLLDGQTVGQSRGIALDADTWGSHGAGAGVLALQFTVP
jgi:hypothetical protein